MKLRSSFVFSAAAAGLLLAGQASAATVFNVPPDPAPSHINAGDTLNVGTGGSVGNVFSAGGGTINVDGGSIGNTGVAADTTINLDSGSIGTNLTIANGSTLNITGGSLGTNFLANDSTVNLFGSDFSLGGTLLNLNPGQTLDVNVSDHDTDHLTGTLTDGSSFNYRLRSGIQFDFSPNKYTFNGDSTLTVTNQASAVPTPSSVMMGLIGLGGLGLGALRRRPQCV